MEMVLASAWKHKRQEISKEKDDAEVSEKTVETSDGSRDAEVPRGSRGAEAENEMQPLRQRGTLGKIMFTKVVTKIQRRWKRPWKKKEHFAMQAEREAYICDWMESWGRAAFSRFLRERTWLHAGKDSQTPCATLFSVGEGKK